jgi:predicted SAM-dependent methyltransferase
MCAIQKFLFNFIIRVKKNEGSSYVKHFLDVFALDVTVETLEEFHDFLHVQGVVVVPVRHVERISHASGIG